MASNKQVLHFRRIKTIPGSFQVLKHNERKKDNLENFVDADKSSFNSYEGAVIDNFYDKYQEMIDGARLKRKIQKNASRIIEFVLSSSHEFCEDWSVNPRSKEKLDAYFAASKKFLLDKYGQVIISSAIHFDETTPHMHVLCVPLVKGKDGIKFSSSEFVGGIKELQALHTEYYEQVGKPFGLERGNMGERTRHSDLKQYKEWETSQRRDMAERSETIQKLEDETKKQNDKIKETAAKWQQYEKIVSQDIPEIPLPPVLQQDRDRRSWRNSVQKMIENAFNGIVTRYHALQMKIKSLMDKNAALAKLVDHWKAKAQKAELDLARKPLEEIRADREARRLELIQNRQRGDFSR